MDGLLSLDIRRRFWKIKIVILSAFLHHHFSKSIPIRMNNTGSTKAKITIVISKRLDCLDVLGRITLLRHPIT